MKIQAKKIEGIQIGPQSNMVIILIIVMSGPTARQRLQHTRGQQYWSSVFFVSMHGRLVCNARKQ
jgi:hypothetical protein